MPTATERVFCPIRVTVWTPDCDSMLDYDWEPLPTPPTASKLRHRLCMQRKAAAESEISFLRWHVAAIASELGVQL